MTSKPARTPQIVATSLLLFQVACGAEQEGPAMAIAGSESETVTAEAGNTPKKTHSLVRLGDEAYEFDRVTCIGTNPATGIATDRANRDHYPTVTLKVFDAELSGGEVINTASVQFRSDTRDELWLLQDGDVEKNGRTFKASGTVKGRRMVTQPNGTLKSAPFADNDLRPFHAQLQCR